MSEEFGKPKPILRIEDDPAAREWMKQKLLEEAKKRERVSGYIAPEDLSEEQQRALRMAFEEREKSTDSTMMVGVAAIDTKGNIVAVPNDGPRGHAEQKAVTKLFATPGGSRELKCIVLVGGPSGHNVIQTNDPRIPRDAHPEDMCILPCGKCREFMHDRTANVEDVEVLSLANNGMVYRTYLRTLYPVPYTSRKVPTRDQWPGTEETN